MARPIEVPVVVKKGTLSRSIEGESKAAFRNMGSSSSAVAPLGRMLGKIRSDADEFTKSIEASNARVIAFGASVGVINGISNAFKKLVEVTISVEKSLVDINVVLNAGSKDLAKFGDGLFKVAKNTAQSFDVVAEAATEFARQGLSLEETLKRTNDALILTRLTGMKAADAVKGLTAATNGFAKAGLTTTQIINKLAAVDVKFAVSADGLVEALKRTGAVAMDAGLSFDELIGMVTAAQQTTARGEAVIGNAFKTIFTRVQRPETLKTLRQLGIAVDDASGKSLSAKKVLEQLAMSYDGLSSSAKDAVNQQVAGVFQINILKAAIGDLQKQNNIASRATRISAAATDQATQKNEMLNTTIAALTAQSGIALTELAKKIGDLALAPGMKNLVQSLKSLVEGTTGVLDGEGTGSKFAKGLLTGIGNVLTGPGLIVIGGVFIKLFKDLTVFGFKSLKNLLGLNNAAKAQAALQQGIGQLLATNVGYNQAMAAAAGNLNKQAAITQTFLAKEITMRAEAVALTSAMAGSAFAGGFRVTGSGEIGKKSKFFGGRRGKVPGLAPTEGVPNFAARVFNPRVTKAGGTGAGSSPFQFTSSSMLGTSENYRGTFNLNASKAALARELPAGLADIVKNSNISGFQMQTRMAGFSPSQQTRMIEQMRDAVSTVPGLSDRAREALITAHTGPKSLIEVNAGITSLRKHISRKERGAYDQHMSEMVTERSFNSAFGTVGTGGRQGADYAIDAVRFRGGRTDPMELKKLAGFTTPMELKKLAGFTTGDATTIASAMKKQLVSGTNPALRNRLREEAQRQNKLAKFEQAMLERFAQEYRSYVINNPGGLRGYGAMGKGSYFTALTRDQLTKGNLANLNPAQQKHIQDEVLRYNRQVLNFAPIGDAIQREKMQVGGLLGMNPSQVQTRVVQNTALRSSFNPQGFGVISPSVGQHSFADAARMHRGQDLRTVNMFPNFEPTLGRPGAAIRPSIPDLSKVDWGKVEATPTGHRAPTPKFIVAGIVPEAAKDFGTATAKAITHEAKKSYPTPSKRGISITPGVDKKAAAAMAKTGGGLGNTAMNTFLAYSAGTMLSGFDKQIEDMLGLGRGRGAGAITGGVTGGYLGAMGGAALGRKFIPGKRGGLLGGLLGTAAGTTSGAFMGGMGLEDLGEYLTSGKMSLFDVPSVLGGGQIPIPGLPVGSPADFMKKKDKGKEIFGATARRNLQRDLKFVREDAAYTSRLGSHREADTTFAASRREGIPVTGNFMRRESRIGRGFDSAVAVAKKRSTLRRERLLTAQTMGRSQAISGLQESTLGGLAGMDVAAGGATGMQFRNIINETIKRGDFESLERLINALQSTGQMNPDGSEVTSKGAQDAAAGVLHKMGKGIPQDVITKGIPDSVFKAVGVDAADQEHDFMDTMRDFVLKGDGKRFADDIIHGAEALKQFNAETKDTLRLDEVTAEIQKFNAEMKNVDQVTRTMESSLGQAFSNMTTGASSVEDAFRNMAVSIFAEINKISSQNIARDIMAAVMPEGGTGQSFLKTLLTPKKQAGGIIKAQNGMYVSGSRTGDKNPALLEDGEYVLNKKFVQGVGKENLDAMNFGMFPRFGKAKGGFMGGIGKMLGLPFTLLAKLFSGIFGGGGGGRETAPMMTGAGSSAQSKRLSATNSKISETNEIMAQLDAISARRGAAPAATVDPKMAGIERRALASRAERQLKGNLKAYGGIRPGALGLPGQAIDGQWSGGRTHTISHIQASKHLTNLMHKGAAQGGPAALTPVLLELGNNPGMFDGMILGGVKFGPDVSILRKVAALQTMMEGRGIQFQTGGRLVSPISQSGVKRSALDEIIKENEFLPPVTGLGSAIGGGGSSLRLGIEDSRLSGFAHSNDPTLQSVRGDIQEWHQKQRDKKFEKQAKRDEMTQMIVGAIIGSVVSAGVNKLSAKNKPLTSDQFDKLENPNTAEYNPFNDPVALGLTAPAGGGAPKAPGMMTAIKQYVEGFRPEPGAYGPGFSKGAFSSDWDWKGSSVGPGGRVEVIRGDSDNPFALQFRNQQTRRQDFEKNFIEFIKEQEAGWPNRGEYKWQRGGHIDNIPAMLTGGEFVMSSSAVRRHGSGALHKLNRGGRIGYQEGGLVGDQQFVPAEGNSADKKQSGTTKSGDSNTTINITVNSSTGETNTSTNGEAGASEREMAVRLADAVKTVLKQEKRTGGMLRDVTSNDQ